MNFIALLHGPWVYEQIGEIDPLVRGLSLVYAKVIFYAATLLEELLFRTLPVVRCDLWWSVKKIAPLIDWDLLFEARFSQT